MRAKWHFGILLAILTVFGISQEQMLVPNQQIVLQFSAHASTNSQVQNTIKIVEEQLEAIGADNIKISDQENGQLRITYYSNADVATVKSTLSKEHSLALDYTSLNAKDQSKLPLEHENNSYNFDVSEILSNTDTSKGVDGKVVLEVNQEFDRFSNPNIQTYFAKIDVKQKDRIVKTALKVHTAIAIAIDNTSHNIPEVRAGPVIL